MNRLEAEEKFNRYEVEVRTKAIPTPRYQRLCTSLSDCYGRYSEAKEHAFEYCKRLEEAFDGHGGRIASYNVNMFTYDFLFEVEDKTYLMHIAPSYNRACPIED